MSNALFAYQVKTKCAGVLPVRKPDFWCIMQRYHQRFGRWPNLLAPRRFTEKVQVAKLRWRVPEMVVLTDKVLAKQRVQVLLGAEWITPTWFSGATLPPIPRRNWRPPFVIKANHLSGANLFVHACDRRDWHVVDATVSAWLATTHAPQLGEWAYKHIRPQVLIEPFIGHSAPPIDYKFYVFGGKVMLIHVHTERFTAHKAAFYTPSWEKTDIILRWPLDSTNREPPACLDQMIEGAEAIASGYPFCRIDLYEVDSRPRFGEVTFYPGSGMLPFGRDEDDLWLGALWPPGQPKPRGELRRPDVEFP